jgi:eukaryotic-like serine/threonine-protein kinase
MTDIGLPRPRAMPAESGRRAIIAPDSAARAPQPSLQDQTTFALTRLGRTLNDRWQLDRLLGVGGMASVYAATHRNGSRVAIKILHPELSVYPELKERFLEEGYAANNVSHPGVVAIHDDGISEDDAIYLVMELLEGETLQARCQRDPCVFSPRDVLSIADQILEVLEAAHAKGIIHRDIKPENICLTRDGRLKLLDFGIAHNEHSRRTHRTLAGSAMGTPAFMPPEQARGLADQIDGRTDLWALGATLFWLASGRMVHSEGTTNEELLQAMTRPAPPLRSVAPLAPRALGRVIDTALAFEKSERFASASSMRVAVWEAFADLDADAAMTLPPLDLSVQQAAVLLPDNDSTANAFFDEPAASYRPVIRTPTPSSPAAPAAASKKRSRKRQLAAFAILAGAIPATISVLLVPNGERSASAAESHWTPAPEVAQKERLTTSGALFIPAPNERPSDRNESAPSIGGSPSPVTEADAIPRGLNAKPALSAMPNTVGRRVQKHSGHLAASSAEQDLRPRSRAPSSSSLGENPSASKTPAAPLQRDPLSRRK